MARDQADFALEVPAAIPAKAGGASVAGTGPWRLALRRLKRNKTALVFAALFVVLVGMCLAAPLYADHVAHTDPYKNHLTDKIVIDGKKTDVVSLDGVPIGPTWQGEFFLGADTNGRDTAVRLLYGGRNSLLIGVSAALITTLLSIMVGAIAGYFRGFTDTVLSRALDVIWAFPVLLLGVALGTALTISGLDIGPIHVSGESKWVPILIIAVVYVPYMARPIRGQVLSLREKEFVEAARAQGAGHLRIMFSEILPNLVVDRDRVLPADGGERDPPRGCARIPGRRRQAAGAIMGHDDRRGRRPDPVRPAPRNRARRDAGPHRPRPQRVR